MRQGKDRLLSNENDDRSHLAERSMHRVSSALWPPSTHRVVATGKAAQRRRDWIVQERWWVMLVDVLTMRTVLVFTTSLVVIGSLCVAILGLHFWYLLLLPVLLFALLLVLPAFLASNAPRETTPLTLSTFAQEFKSSTGLLTCRTQELKSDPGSLQGVQSSPAFLQDMFSSPGFLQNMLSNPGFLQELRSNPGFLQDVQSSQGFLQQRRSNPGLLTLAASTMPLATPAQTPLVRVLETYDLRGAQVTHFLESSAQETGKYTVPPVIES